ncbi:MAG: fused MFS/spermidine synthase [Planctomycetota bacterium]|nr:fused MFS/spermidine synthase [Planctomycetota bacterium]
MTSPTPARTEPGSKATLLLITAALSGAAVMCIELSAVRLLAPWFGTSLPVWSNVIAVVLLGLSIGYLFGGRASRGPDPAGSLAKVLALAAVATAWLPFLAGPIAELFLPAELDIEQASSVFRWGSLASSLCLFLPASAILGCVGPLVVELLGRSGLGAGEAGGRALFASTLGSLIGVFGTSHWAVPELGLRGTLLLAAGALVLALVSISAVRASLGKPQLGLLLVALFGAVLSPASRALPAGFRQLATAESPYQRVRVVEELDQGVRFLAVNESTNSYQSVWQPKLGLLDGDYYYNDFALPPAWAAREQGPLTTWSTLCIGMGAGTAKRVLEGSLAAGTSLAFTGVELDPEVVRLGSLHMDLEQGPDDLLISDLDGRAALRCLSGPFDQVLVDAYANQVELPAHLVTLEFFQEVRERLAPGGWCQVNVGGADTRDPLVRAVAGTLARAMQSPVLLLRVPGTRNLMLTSRREARPPVPTDEAWYALPAELQRIVRGREVRGQWDWLEADAPFENLLTDNHAPVEALQQRSVEHSLARRNLAR